MGCHFLLRGSSQSRDQTWDSCIQADSLLSEPPGNIPVGEGVFYCLKVIIYKGCGQQIFNSYLFYMLNILEKEGANPPESLQFSVEDRQVNKLL